VFHFEIPSIDSGVALSDEITRLNRRFSTPHSLIIYHYGGKDIHTRFDRSDLLISNFLQSQAMETKMRPGSKELERIGEKVFGQPKQMPWITRL
jgi:hypothetical protein